MRGGALTLAAILAALAAPSSALALDVTKTADTNDGACDADCSLREAVVAANGAGGPDVINVPAGTYRLTLGGASENLAATGDLDVTEDVTVRGAGAAATIVDAGGDGGLGDRIWDIRAGTGTITDMTITGGRPPDADPNGGGVSSDGSATLERVIVSGNRGGAGAEGGGVVEDGGGTTVVIIRDSLITGNEAPFGGGVSENGGSQSPTEDVGVVIERSTISDNRAISAVSYADGGGVIEDGGGELHIRDSAITGNLVESPDAFGGGVSGDGGGETTIANSTISGNTASGSDSYGGGYGENGGGTATMTNVTIADNRVTGPGTSTRHNGANVAMFGSGDLTVKNSVLGLAAPANCGIEAGTLTSTGNNVESGNSCGFTPPADKIDADPGLRPLAANGGPTQTHRLALGSPAVDAGDNAACPGSDQRGIARPQPAGGTCDSGAFEQIRADLAVTTTDAPDPVLPGQAVTYTLAIMNAGPSAAPDVNLEQVLADTGVPATARIARVDVGSAQASQGSCSGTGPVVCTLGLIPVGGSAQVTVVATPAQGDQPRGMTSTATVSSIFTDDPSDANNRALAETLVPGPCADRRAPISRLRANLLRLRGRRPPGARLTTAQVARRKLTLRGRSRDPGCAADATHFAVRGRIDRIQVSVAKVRGRGVGKNCRFMRANGTLNDEFTQCRRPILLRARRKRRFRFSIRGRFESGNYRIVARGTDVRRNKERPTRGRNILRFRVP